MAEKTTTNERNIASLQARELAIDMLPTLRRTGYATLPVRAFAPLQAHPAPRLVIVESE